MTTIAFDSFPKVKELETRYVKRATKDYRCSVCSTTIHEGGPYWRHSFTHDGRFSCARTHVHCPQPTSEHAL